MFDIVFLGTSASAPSVYRGMPAQAVLAGEYRFLVDCGEGTQRQILRSGIGYKRLHRILLTHAHLDHILGMGGLVSTFANFEDVEKLEIWGSRVTLRRLSALLFGVVLDYERLAIDITLHEIEPGLIFESKDFTLRAFPVTHRGHGSFGFVFQERDRRPFLVEKAEALGIPAGPERGQLVHGESITLADGRIITPDMVLGDVIPGTKVVFTGDIARLDNVRDDIASADALVSEATFLHDDADTARRFGHITARQAAEAARELDIKTLILTHVSRRYRERDVIAEAVEVFAAAHVARDMDIFSVRRDKPIQKGRAHYQNPDPESE